MYLICRHVAIPCKTVSADNDNGGNMERTQYPLRLSFAVTIHKCQSLTLNLAKIDIGRTEKSLGLTYVALSRVRRLEDLLLVFFDVKRLKDINQLYLKSNVQAHDEQTTKLVEETVKNYKVKAFIIYYFIL